MALLTEWLSDSTVKNVKSIFDDVAQKVGERIDRQSDVSETTLTENLIDTVNEIASQEPIVDEESQARLRVRAAKNKYEGEMGADLGVILDVNFHKHIFQKAILVQSKRVFNKGKRWEYTELRRRGKKQANDMLRITPASFFFLYNPIRLLKDGVCGPALRERWIKLRMVEEFNDWHPIFILHPHLFVEMPWNSEHQEAFASILVVSANLISSWGKGPPGEVTDLIPSAIGLTDFIGRLFLPSFVGDPRPQTIESAQGVWKRGRLPARNLIQFRVTEE